MEYMYASQILALEIAPASFPTSPDLAIISDNWWKPSVGDYPAHVKEFMDAGIGAIDNWLDGKDSNAVLIGFPPDMIMPVTSIELVEIDESTNISNMDAETGRESGQEVYQTATLQDIRTHMNDMATSMGWANNMSFEDALDF